MHHTVASLIRYLVALFLPVLSFFEGFTGQASWVRTIAVGCCFKKEKS
jgi:hypothetical protein